MSKRILVADDALIIREIIKDRAREAGFEVVGEAINGKDAFEKFAQLRPDVATMDLVMPEYDGLYGLREIITAGIAAVEPVQRAGGGRAEGGPFQGQGRRRVSGER